MTTLARIRTKVRRLTGSPSPTQLTNAQIDENVNDFYQFDFPEHLRVTQLNEKFDFLLAPGRDLYELPENYAINNGSPIYIDGQLARYTEDQTEFYNWWPRNTQTGEVATGTGSATYNYTLSSTPILPGSFSTSGQRSNDVWFNMVDQGLSTQATSDVGTLRQLRSTYTGGTINYQTGAVEVIFPVPIESDGPIYASYETYSAGRPTSVLYFHTTAGLGRENAGFDFLDTITRRNIRVRPVPDKAYQMVMEVWRRPRKLEDELDAPILNEWWQLLAIGAAKKILEDRMDIDSVQNLLPQYHEQMSLCIYRTAVQYSTQRTATIYTEMMNNAGAYGWNHGIQ